MGKENVEQVDVSEEETVTRSSQKKQERKNKDNETPGSETSQKGMRLQKGLGKMTDHLRRALPQGNGAPTLF